MNALRKNPVLRASLIVAALLAVGELGWIWERATAARAAAVKLERKRAELGTLRDLAPAPTREVAAAVAADLARAQQTLTAMQAELQGHGAASERVRQAKVPAARTDAYFDLATFVERTRELARKNDVEIRPDAARFGFATYLHEGPEPERIEPVFRQRQIAQYLVESLIEARPRALLAVKRERPLTAKEREERDATLAAEAAAGTAAQPVPPPPSEETPDLFSLDPRRSVRAPGYLDTTAFRLVFIGQTAALRTFLNRLATFELPVLVREVEVEPVTADELAAHATLEENAAAEPVPASIVLSAEPRPARRAEAPASSAQTAPIVAKPFSKFTVTVEYIQLVPVATAAAPEKPTT